MKAVALLPIFLLFFLFIFLSPVSAYHDIDADGDTYSSSWQPTNNFNHKTTMYVQNITTGIGQGNYSVFLSFPNITAELPAGQTIVGAELYLWLQSFYAYQNGTTVDVDVFNTTYFNEANLTWNTQPATDTLISTTAVLGSYDWKNFSIMEAVNSSYENGNPLYLRLDLNDWSPAQSTLFSFTTKEFGSGLEPYIRIYTGSGSGCNSPDDYEIGSVCLDQDTFYINDGCNYTTTDCPSGFSCMQSTPVVNATSDIYENYTSCQITTSLGITGRCFNICYNNVVIFSNCVEAGCKVCSANSDGSRTYDDITVDGSIVTVNGYFTNTYYSNESFITVPQWTASCIHPNGTQIYYNETGGIEDIISLLNRTGNNVTPVPPSGTLLIPTDEGTNELKEWLNAGMGTNYGSDIISLIVSGVVSILVFVNLKHSDKSSSLLFGTFFFVASVFSFVGLLTIWFLVLEVTLVGVLIFWKAKVS